MKIKRILSIAISLALLLQMAGCSAPTEPTIGINSYTGNASIESESQTSNSDTTTSNSEETADSQGEETATSSAEGNSGNGGSPEESTTSLPESSDSSSANSSTDQASSDSSETDSSSQASSAESEEGSSSEDTEASEPSSDTSSSSGATSSDASSSEVQENESSSQPESSDSNTSSEDTPSKPESEEPPALGGYKPIADEKRYCLKSGELSQAQKLLYYNIKNAVKMQKESLDISPSAAATADDIRLIMQSVNTDYPEYYWLSGDYTFYYSNDYVTKIDFNYLPFNDAYTEALNEVVNNFCDNVPSDLSEYELELLAHDFICEKAEYDHSTAGGATNNPHAYSAYGALVNGLCVCEGYSRAMQLLMNRLGVQCSLVRGTANGDGHMWNVIQIDSKWYHLDVTWDDPTGAEHYNHFFFNLPTTEILSEGHIVDPDFAGLSDKSMNFNVKTPPCTETLYSYFTVNKTYLTAKNEERVIKNAIEKAKENELSYCEFHAGETSSFQSILESDDKKSALASVLANCEITSFQIVSSGLSPNRFMICW